MSKVKKGKYEFLKSGLLSDQKYSELKQENIATKLIIGGVLIILFMGFMTLLIALAGILLDGWRFHASNYNEFMQVLKTQERIIESYTEEQKSINEIIKRIENHLEIIE